MQEPLTVFDENLNLNLYMVVTPKENPSIPPGQIGVGFVKARLDDFDMTQYKKTDYPLVLDVFTTYGEDPDNLYKMLFHCASPTPFFNSSFTLNDCKTESAGKSRFIHSLWDHSKAAHTDDYSFQDYSLSTVAQCINPGTLTIMSIPAFMAIAFDGTRDVDKSRGISLGLYKPYSPNPQNPGSLLELDTFDEYFDAFMQGNFMGSNTDLFLTTYGIANSFCCLDFMIRGALACGEEIHSIEEVVGWKPIIELWQRLVSVRAIYDPFNAPMSYKVEEYGVSNARILNPDLADALKLAERILPFPLFASAPGATARVFYALIELFSMQSYFGIKGTPTFEDDHPAATDSRQTAKRKGVFGKLFGK